MAGIKHGYTTRVLSTPYPKEDAFKSLQMPVYDTVAFEFETSQDIADAFQNRQPAHIYSRSSNPTVEYFERKIIEVTGGRSALALTSGMAAISNVMLAVVEQGENIITSPHLFGHTYGLFRKTLPDMGIETRFTDLLNYQGLEKLIDGKTRLIFFETVTNPQLEVADISRLAGIASRHGILLVADSTLTPFNVFNAGSFGIDIEVLSTTKFISGGATSVGGIIVDTGINDWKNVPKLQEAREKAGELALMVKLRKEIFRNFGSCMSPRTAQMQSMGLDILDLRVERCLRNCMALAEYLSRNEKISRVRYPGLAGSPFFKLSQSQFKGVPGTIITFELDSEPDCFRFMDKLRTIRRATNMNDNKSLVIHPWSTIYSEYPEELRMEMQVTPGMIRLSVGIEDIDDLVEDIRQALG